MQNWKNAGGDNIAYEFYKNLPESGINYLCDMYNKIYDSGKVPDNWHQILALPLYKKGEIDNPGNYRIISLLCCGLKLLTSILAARLEVWSELHRKLPETQAGFRKRRSCLDNLSILAFLSQMALACKRKLYIILVDQRKAFDQICQWKLWERLNNLGVSYKMIQVLRSIYNGMSMWIRDVEHMQGVEVTRGVLQGESISPLLFILFTSTMETFFRERGAEGVRFGGGPEVLSLEFADDQILFCESPRDVNRKLEILAEFCGKNELQVNEDKTKILCFHKGRLKASSIVSTYEGKEIDTVTRATYLGVVFSSSSLFLEAANAAMSKARVACGAVFKMLSKSKNRSWEAQNRLFCSIIISTLMYGVEIWGLRYLDKLEMIQVGYYKRLLKLPVTTPSFYVRLEAGVVHTAYKVIEVTLSWVLKLAKMTEDRLPKRLALAAIRHHAEKSNAMGNIKYNWWSQLLCVLKKYGYSGDITITDVHIVEVTTVLKREVEAALNQVKSFLTNADRTALEQSSYSHKYIDLMSHYSADKGFLCNDMPFVFKQVLAQLRASGNYKFRIKIKKFLVTIDPKQTCTVCNMIVPESLYHFMCVCPIYKSSRLKYIPETRDLNEKNYHLELLCNVDFKRAANLFNYLLEVAKLRAYCFID